MDFYYSFTRFATPQSGNFAKSQVLEMKKELMKSQEDTNGHCKGDTFVMYVLTKKQMSRFINTVFKFK